MMLVNVISTDSTKSFTLSFDVKYATEIGEELGGRRHRIEIYDILSNHSKTNFVFGFFIKKFQRFLEKNGITFDNFAYIELTSEPVNDTVKTFYNI